MSDEADKKINSLPPPPTDEIDQEWGGEKNDEDAAAKPAEAKPEESKSEDAAKAAPAASAQPVAKARAEDDEDEEEEDDEDEQEEEEEDEDEDEDDEDEDEDEDEDDDAEEEEDRAERRAQRASGSSIEDMIPDWGPWAVLGGLLLLGLLGGFGFLGGKRAEASEEVGSTTTTTSTTPATTAAATATTASPAASIRRLEGEGERIEASHLLVKYKGALRADASVTRTKEEAKKRAEEALAKLKKGTDFAAVVNEYSEDVGSARRGGALGSFTRDRMVKPFSDAAFALKPGETSGLVESPFGHHIIRRTT